MTRPTLGACQAQWRSSAAALAAAALVASAHGQPRSTLQLLPTLGGSFATATGINDRGQVVGYGTTVEGLQRAALWSQNSVTVLAPVPGLDNPVDAVARYVATGVNNTGQVVGYVQDRFGDFIAVRWSASNNVEWLTSGSAHAINDAGISVGNRGTSTSFATTAWGPQVTYHPYAGDQQYSVLTSVNAAGLAAGWVRRPDNSVQSFTSFRSEPMQFLGSLGGDTYASGINTQGQVVGSSADSANISRSFIYDTSTGIRSLGITGTSTATAINDHSQVVGYRSGMSAGAYIWTAAGGATFLSTLSASSATLDDAYAINRHAQIVGRALDGLVQRAFLLTLHPDWTGGDGAWDDSTGQRWNWAGTGTAAAKVGAMHDVVINPGLSATVRASADGVARSLVLGGTANQLVTLDLAGETTRLLQDVRLAAGGVLRGNGRLAAGGTLEVDPGARMQIDAGVRMQVVATGLVNRGLLRAQGTGLAPAQLELAGPLINLGGQMQLQQADVVLASGLVNAGSLAVNQATVDSAGITNSGQIVLQNAQLSTGSTGLSNQPGGQLVVSFGTSLISGPINNLPAPQQQASTGMSRIIVSNGAQATFADPLINNGELRVSAGGAANFLGLVSGAGAITGSGQARFEGGFSPGNSPAMVTLSTATSIGAFSTVLMELGGATPGNGDGFHDKLIFNGSVVLEGGPLQVAWWGGYAPSGGEQFDLFDWNGGLTGAFGLIELPALAGGLAWDTSRLYSNGEIGITPVTEPQTWALMLAGLAWMGWRQRGRKRSGCPHALNAWAVSNSNRNTPTATAAATAHLCVARRRAPRASGH